MNLIPGDQLDLSIYTGIISGATIKGTIGGISVVSSATGINSLNTGNTLLYTVPAGRTFIPVKSVFLVTSGNAVTAGPSVNIYTSTTGDIYANTNLTALTGSGLMFGFESFGMSTSVSGNGNIYLNISSGANGTGQKLTVDLIGYLK